MLAMAAASAGCAVRSGSTATTALASSRAERIRSSSRSRESSRTWLRRPDCAAPSTSPSRRWPRSARANSKPSVVAATACRRSQPGVVSPASATSRHHAAADPRPTRPRSWCSWEIPNRSASSTTMTVAFGTSTPTSITVVATRTSISPAANRRMTASLSSADSRPCRPATRRPASGPSISRGSSSSTAAAGGRAGGSPSVASPLAGGSRSASSSAAVASSSAAASPIRGQTTKAWCPAATSSRTRRHTPSIHRRRLWATTQTYVVAQSRRRWMDGVWRRVRDEVAAGHQAFVVCPRIGDAAADEDATAAGEDADLDPPANGDATDGDPPARPPAAAVLEQLPRLMDGPLTGLRVAGLHGRLSAEDKDAVMRRFAAGEIDVLVATTVIEVGVDVPNATVMVVLDADRFGISQLHQLRGRVGRGSAAAWCLLVADAGETTPGWERLQAVAATTDGFELARADLGQRREGDVLGAAQSGRRSHVRLLSLLRDEDLIRSARDEASAVVAVDPDLTAHPALAAAIANMLDEDRAEYLEKA